MRAQENNNVNANTKWEFCGTFTLLDYTRDVGYCVVKRLVVHEFTVFCRALFRS